MTRFKQDDAPRVYEIEQRLSSIQQGSMDVSAYYTELVTLWEEYKNYIELPVCTCGRCECNAAVLWEKLQQRGRVTKFLMGLNETYEQTRRHILMLKPIPTIEEAYNIVAQDEKQRSVKPVVKSENVIFQTSGNFEGSGLDFSEYVAAYNTYRPRNNTNRPLCTYSGQLGHTIQKCYRVHGYPPGFKQNNSNNKGSFNPRGQSFSSPRPQFKQPENNMVQQKTVANVFTEEQSNMTMPYYPPPAVNTLSLDVSKLSQEQVQVLIKQLTPQLRLPEPAAPVSQSSSSISEKGVMAVNSSSGNVVTISSNLRYENHSLTFQHHCLTSLQNALPMVLG